ncbi:MAG: hypothetical protein ACTSPV_01100 [Candidatus Hodarchaeales archaeon]
MKQEFNLSEKIVLKILEDLKESPKYEELMYLRVEDVKEFIRRLKEVFKNTKVSSYGWSWEYINKEIDKLAGEKLVE